MASIHDQYKSREEKKKLQPSEIAITITFGSHFCGLVKMGPNPVVTRIIKAQEIGPPWGEKGEGGT